MIDNETETKDTWLAQFIFPIAKCHPAICVVIQWRDGTKVGNVRQKSGGSIVTPLET